MNHKYRFSSTWPKRIGLGVMLTLLALSALFFKERTLFADISYQTFLMIQEGGLQVQVFRFGSAIVHILPFLAIKAHFPIAAILFLYSISFTLLYLGLYVLIVKWLKNDFLGLTLAFLFTLTVFDGFYWATSEFQQGLAFTLFFFAFLLRYPALNTWRQKIFVLIFVPTLVFYHPLIFVVFFFLCLYFLLEEKDFRRKEMYWVAAYFIVIMVLKHLFAGNWYDSGKFTQFTKGLADYFPNYLSMPVNKKFLINSLKYWYLFPVFFVGVMAWYFKQKKWMASLLVFGACFGYIALIHIGSPHATYRFYIEVSYMPLTIFVMLPFVSEMLPKFTNKVIITFLLIIFSFRLIVIANNHKPFAERLEWISAKIGEGRQKKEGQLFVLQKTPEIEEKTIISWGVSYESILLTAMENRENPACLLILQRNGQYGKELQENQVLLTNFQQIAFEDLDEFYFPFGVGRYVFIGEE